MKRILENLKANQNRESTKKNYLAIWRQFNKFLTKLHPKPKFWEDRIKLYFAYLVDNGIKSTTLRCYLSALKNILKTDGYQWDDGKMLLSTIVRACKIQNNVVKAHFPIHRAFLEQILFEVERIYKTSQPYLNCLFKAIFCMGYYGLMRIGEVVNG